MKQPGVLLDWSTDVLHKLANRLRLMPQGLEGADMEHVAFLGAGLFFWMSLELRVKAVVLLGGGCA